MKWVRERDALIAQTLAFVQSVTGRKEDFRQPDTAPVMPAPIEAATFLVIERKVEIAVEAPHPILSPPPAQPVPFAQAAPLAQPLPAAQPSSPRTSGDFRNEIQARVANFRKHQERFEREREEYCTTTMARLRAEIRDTPLRPPVGK
jgi:hypothetical protein